MIQECVGQPDEPDPWSMSGRGSSDYIPHLVNGRADWNVHQTVGRDLLGKQE